MSLTITKGYLLNIADYQLFDQIITFINEYGNIFSCISLGSRKIMSKNARNLRFGSLIEFEFFAPRSIEKVGKLKKAVAIDNTPFSISNNNALIVLNKLFYQSKPNGLNFYKMYQKNIELIKKEIDVNSLIINIIFDFINLNGIKLFLDGCVVCKSKKIINFCEAKMGFVCNLHNQDTLKISKDIIKILYLINNKKFAYLQNFDYQSKYITIKFLMYLTNSYLGINLYFLLLY